MSAAAPLPVVTAAPPVSLRHIFVAFGAVVALDDVTVDLEPGTRHAIVGENGAGKSTLMRVLFGQIRPDRGQIIVAGQMQRFGTPGDAIRLGIGMVHQHFELIGSFTVAENIVLGAEPGTGLLLPLDRKRAEHDVARLASESGLPLDPRARVDELSVAAQQRVEIVKALYRRARVLILDEPTAVLGPAEARELWAATARLSQAGTTVVFITHKLDEVMAHADHVTVLRRGRRVLSSPIRETDAAHLAQAMVGEGMSVSVSPSPASPFPTQREGGTGVRAGEAVLSLRDLTVQGRRGETAAKDVSLDVHGGEIVGIAGVDGSGQTELIEAILGLREIAGGEILLGGENVNGLPVAARRARGIAYVPEDRHHRALVLPFSVEENAVLGRQREPAFAAGPGRVWLRREALRQFLRERADAFDVRGATPGTPARALSGGNQQKLVLARELSRHPSLLIAAQPTRGLDFAASAFVHGALRRERDRGAAVLLQSLDLAEVLALSDQVAVMLRGRIVAVVPRGEVTEARVGALMTGAATTE